MRILVIVPYFDRPAMLRNALRSVVESIPFPGEWRLALHDDGSKVPGEPIAREVLGPLASRARFGRCEDTPNRAFQLGLRMNDILLAAEEDLAVVLCDDDQLSPGYLAGLHGFFAENPGYQYAYSKNRLMDEDGEELEESWGRWDWDWSGDDIDPTFRTDISQVAWRIRCNREDGVWFPTWAAKNQDTEFFRRMYLKYGPCPCTGLKGQMKRVHADQLAFQHGKMDVDAMVAEAAKSAGQFADAGVYDLAERLLAQALSVRPDDEASRDLLEKIRAQAGQGPPKA